MSDGLGTRRRRRVRSTSLRLSGMALLVSAAGMLGSAGVGVLMDGDEVGAVALASGVTAAVGVALWVGTEVGATERRSTAFTAVVVSWLLVCLAGSLPFLLSGTLPSFQNALFESVSGFTTTGASVLPSVEGNPAGVLFWRSTTHWLGGMGIILLAVAVLPALGVGGLELLGNEASGPTTDRLEPRIAVTARRLLTVYLVLTVLGIVLLLATGLDLYDAVTHTFGAIATGGFSTYNLGILQFDSLAVEAVTVFLMVAGSTNFTLHWLAVRQGVRAYWRDSEWRLFVGLLLGSGLFVTALLWLDGQGLAGAARDGFFNVISVFTTTGFTHVDFTGWVAATQLVLLLLMIVGGMAGSTSGGLKVLRLQVLSRFSVREIRQARHPRAVLPLHAGSGAIPEDVVYRVVGFVLLYVAIGLGSIILVTATGPPLLEAAGAVASCMGGVGPGLGAAGPAGNYLVFDPVARWLFMALMLVGRLEVVPMLLVLALLFRRMGAGVTRARS